VRLAPSFGSREEHVRWDEAWAGQLQLAPRRPTRCTAAVRMRGKARCVDAAQHKRFCGLLVKQHSAAAGVAGELVKFIKSSRLAGCAFTTARSLAVVQPS
jgi:hypothetical protein